MTGMTDRTGRAARVYLLDCWVFQAFPALYDRCYGMCPESRRRKIDRLRFFDDKARSLGVYTLLVLGLRELFGMAAAPELRIKDSGKPFADIDGLHFNFSHSGSYAACGFSSEPLGVDIERGIKDMAPGDIRMWSLREAYGKYTEKGITEKGIPPLPETDGRDSFCFWKDRYIFSKMVDGHILSVCSCEPRVEVRWAGSKDIERLFQ